MEKDEQGDVKTWLLVGADGKAERCGIVASSGSTSLDAQTCKVLISNARFRPAHLANGSLVSSIFFQALAWRLEDVEKEEAQKEELQALTRLRSEMQRPAKEAKLLNGDTVAGAMDYPKTAIAKEQTGRTVMLLLVGADGRVTRCAIEESSGSDDLDEQSCNLMIANAHFDPARNRRTYPVKSVLKQTVNWQLQSSSIRQKDWIIRASFLVGPQAQIRSCKSEFLVNETWTEASQKVCERSGSWYVLNVAKEKSKAVDTLVVVENWQLTTPDHSIPNVGSNPGEVLVLSRSATATYDGDGKRTSCTAVSHYGIPEIQPDLCVSGGIPDPLPEGVVQPKDGPVTLRVLLAVYLKDEPG